MKLMLREDRRGSGLVGSRAPCPTWPPALRTPLQAPPAKGSLEGTPPPGENSSPPRTRAHGGGHPPGWPEGRVPTAPQPQDGPPSGHPLHAYRWGPTAAPHLQRPQTRGARSWPRGGAAPAAPDPAGHGYDPAKAGQPRGERTTDSAASDAPRRKRRCGGAGEQMGQGGRAGARARGPGSVPTSASPPQGGHTVTTRARTHPCSCGWSGRALQTRRPGSGRDHSLCQGRAAGGLPVNVGCLRPSPQLLD